MMSVMLIDETLNNESKNHCDCVTGGDKLPDWHKVVFRVSYPRQKLYCHHWHYFILDWHNGQQLTIIISGNITVVGVIIMWLPIAGTGIISLVAAAWGHKVATKQQLKTQTPALLAL